MKGTVNGVGINGTALPNWVVRAVVVAVAASTVNVEQTRTTFGNVHADASVVVTLTQTHTIAARATGTAECSHYVAPTIIHAAAASTTATAFGAGAVRRDVYADAGGDATATGLAISADALGDAQASCAATVDVCDAHIIHPGRANVTCSATQVVSAGDVTRYTSVTNALGSVGYTRAEASIKLNGESFYRLDGFVPSAKAFSTNTLIAERISLILTQVPTALAHCQASAQSFIRHPARASAFGLAVALPVDLFQRVHLGAVNALATASAIVLAVRQVRPTAFSTSTASVIALRARQRHQSAAQASSQAISEKVQRLYTTFGYVDGVLAHASLLSTTFGQQVFGLAQASALSASQQANTTRNFAAAANTQATASSNPVVIGRQFFADSFSQSQSHTLAPNALIKYRAQAIATTVSDLVSSTYGTQHRASAQNVSDSSAATVMAIHNYAGRASGYTIATSDALGFANSDKLAPDERYMIVPQGVREMTVFFDEREMKVAA